MSKGIAFGAVALGQSRSQYVSPASASTDTSAHAAAINPNRLMPASVVAAPTFTQGVSHARIR